MDEHIPVLVEEVVEGLGFTAARTSQDAQRESLYVDATFGRGGHAARILAHLGEHERLLALDRDPQAVAAGRRRFAHDSRVVVVHAAFGALETLVATHGGGRPCRGILLDLGVSSPQLGEAARGFSFQHDGPLDMRMDTSGGTTAAQYLATASADEIRTVIATLGEERFAQRIARAVVEARSREPLTRTSQLAQLVARAVPTREAGKNPATRTFQALRMHVNDELGEIERALHGALKVLAPLGRLAVISFHSLEDRLVKSFMRAQSSEPPELRDLPVLPANFAPPMRLIGRKQRASEAEIAANPRSRSATLRVAERVLPPGAGA